MRRLRFRVLLAISGMLVGVLALLSTAPTLAAWQDREFGGRTFTAGIVPPPVNLTCNKEGFLNGTLVFRWSAPVANGIATNGFGWSSSAALLAGQASGVFPAGTTSFQPNLAGLGIGTITFNLWTVGTSGTPTWISTVQQKSFQILTGAITQCL